MVRTSFDIKIKHPRKRLRQHFLLLSRACSMKSFHLCEQLGNDPGQVLPGIWWQGTVWLIRRPGPGVEDQSSDPCCCSSVTKSCLTLWPHGLHPMDVPTRLAWPSRSPRISSNSCPLSQWSHPAISSSVVLLSSWPQSFPAIRVFSNESAQEAKALELQLQHQSF